MYFNKVFLGHSKQDNKDKNTFLKKYVNFNNCAMPMFFACRWWGLHGKYSKNLKILETIMKLQCFDGINQMKSNSDRAK